MPRYNKNFITEAILRIDFSAPILELTGVVNEELDRFIMRFFSTKRIEKFIFRGVNPKS